MHPFPEEIVPPPLNPEAMAETGRHDPPTAVVHLVRDGAVPSASCPHCGGGLQLSTVGARWQVKGPTDVADRLTLQLGMLEREELHVLVLNTRNVVIAQDRVYQGNVSASVVRIGELFRCAVERHAAGIILVHNHPSGEVKPSVNDLHLTTEAIRAGHLLDIAVLDHLIVGGGDFVSLRDYGVAFDKQHDGHVAREPRPAYWRDPRYGAYKSAVQKYIRRSEIDKAVAAASQLAELPGGRSSLERRLTVIAAEDVGWRWIPAVGRAGDAVASVADDPAREQLLRITASLASLPKSREAYWLGATCWNGRRIPPNVSREALSAAIATGDHRAALAICLAAVESRQWRSGRG